MMDRAKSLINYNQGNCTLDQKLLVQEIINMGTFFARRQKVLQI